MRPVIRRVRVNGWRATVEVSTPMVVMEDGLNATTPAVGLASAAVAATSAMPQMVHLPGRGEVTEGCIGQRYSGSEASPIWVMRSEARRRKIFMLKRNER